MTVPVPIPVYQPPTLVQSMGTPQNSNGDPTATQQAVKPGSLGSSSNHPYIYKDSGITKASGFGAFTEALMPAASSGHAMDSNSQTLQSSIKKKPNTASKRRTATPFKQLPGSDGQSSTGIHAISFKEVNGDDNQSQKNDDDANLMILGQDLAINMDAWSEPEQVSKACQYQWCND